MFNLRRLEIVINCISFLKRKYFFFGKFWFVNVELCYIFVMFNFNGVNLLVVNNVICVYKFNSLL